MMKKLFTFGMLGLPFALLFLFIYFLSSVQGDEYQDLKEFVRNAGMDMRGKIDPPPDFEATEPVSFGGGSCKPQAVFSSQRLKRK